MSAGTVEADDGRGKCGLPERACETLIAQAQQDAQRLDRGPVDREEMFAIQRFTGVLD